MIKNYKYSATMVINTKINDSISFINRKDNVMLLYYQILVTEFDYFFLFFW